MKDEDRRDNFLLYNPIEMSKLKDNYTVPSEVSGCNRIIEILLYHYLMFTLIVFISIKMKGEICSMREIFVSAKHFFVYFAQEQIF